MSKTIREGSPGLEKENAGNESRSASERITDPIILFAPEHFYLYSTLAVPQLTGYLLEQGYPVVPRVLDHEFYTNLSTRDSLHRSIERVRDVLASAPEALVQYLSASLSLATGGEVAEPQAKSNDRLAVDLSEKKNEIVPVLHEAERLLRTVFLGLDPMVFLLSLARLQCALDLFAAPFWPNSLNIMYGISTPGGTRNSTHIHDVVSDARQNPFISYYSEHVLPTVPDDIVIAGISITHAAQMIPGFTLAHLLKRLFPDVHVVVGGTIVNTSRDFLRKSNGLWEFFDSLIVEPGEQSLAGLYDQLASSSPELNRVPNLTWKDRGGNLHSSDAKSSFTLADIATPVFTDPRPNPILTLTTSTSCDWGRCRFCHFKSIMSDEEYQTRPIENVVRDLRILNERYDPSFYTLCDTNVSIQQLDSIAKAIENENVSPLYAFARAEKRLTDLEFCKRLRRSGFFSFHIGVESGSQRLLDDMNKGIKLENVSRILKNLHEADFLTNIFIMVGTPTETLEEIRQTTDFLKSHIEYINGAISIGPYELERRQEIFRDPEKYGIQHVDDADEDLTDKVSCSYMDELDADRVPGLIADMYQELGIQNHYMIQFFYTLLDMIQKGRLRYSGVS